jgi:hypothetical protein
MPDLQGIPLNPGVDIGVIFRPSDHDPGHSLIRLAYQRPDSISRGSQFLDHCLHFFHVGFLLLGGRGLFDEPVSKLIEQGDSLIPFGQRCQALVNEFQRSAPGTPGGSHE